jgi:acyl-coenzyme A thioesterase PaaI-like protein
VPPVDPGLEQAAVTGTPFARTLGARVLELDRTRAVLELHAAEGLRNHLDGPHAATLFGLAETAAAAVCLSPVEHLVADRCVALDKGAQSSYLAVARGRVVATAELACDEEGVRASVAARGVAVFPVDVTVTDDAGTVTTRCRADMALKKYL